MTASPATTRSGVSIEEIATDIGHTMEDAAKRILYKYLDNDQPASGADTTSGPEPAADARDSSADKETPSTDSPSTGRSEQDRHPFEVLRDGIERDIKEAEQVRKTHQDSKIREVASAVLADLKRAAEAINAVVLKHQRGEKVTPDEIDVATRKGESARTDYSELSGRVRRLEDAVFGTDDKTGLVKDVGDLRNWLLRDGKPKDFVTRDEVPGLIQQALQDDNGNPVVVRHEDLKDYVTQAELDEVRTQVQSNSTNEADGFSTGAFIGVMLIVALLLWIIIGPLAGWVIGLLVGLLFGSVAGYIAGVFAGKRKTKKTEKTNTTTQS